MLNKALFTSNKDDYETPIDLFNKLDQEFHFTLDPCSNQYNHKVDNFFTIKEDGLSQSWKNEIVFCNPPYGRKIYDWVKKAYYENLYNDVTVVLLIPSRTDTKYFHEFLYNKNNVELRFLKGRLKFGNCKTSAPFPSLIAIMKNNH